MINIEYDLGKEALPEGTGVSTLVPRQGASEQLINVHNAVLRAGPISVGTTPHRL